MVAAATWLERSGAAAPDWLLGLFGQGLGLDGTGFYLLLWLAFAGYLLCLLAARELSRPLLWTLVVGLAALFAVAPPLLSQDVFSYIAYARMGAEHGLNPYLEAPAAIAGDPVLRFVGWPDAVSVYGPLFTLASYGLAPLSLATSLWLNKAIAAAAVVGTAALCERIAIRRGVPSQLAVAVVALNPLVLVHVIGGAHNDALLALLLTASVAALVAERAALGGASLAATVAIKVSGAYLAPFALIGALRGRRLAPFLAGGLIALALVAATAALVFGGGVFDSLALVGDNQGQTSRYSLPATASRLVGIDLDSMRTLFLVGWALAVAWLLAWCLRGGDWIRAAGWAGLATLLASGWLLPWYLIWVLPLVAVSRDRPLLLATLALTAFQLINRVPF